MPTPRDTHVPRLLTIVGLLGVLGCPVDEVPADGETGGSDLLPGTLVITEIVANVPGDDEGLEWFEIYNASSETVDLEGLVLVYEKVDGTGRKTHTVARSVEVPAGGYVVVGSLLDELAGSGHVDYGYANELGDFGNTAGYLAIEAGTQDIVDETYYENPSETASRTFDGSQSPDSIANDNLDNWCDSQAELSPDFAATPGAANDVCGGATTCLQDGEVIDIVHPLPGELVITEVLPNPEYAADDFGEWFELHSLASTDIHLNGLDIGKSLEDPAEDTIAWPECIPLAAGQYALVGRSMDPLLNGEVPAELVVWETDMTLTNNDGSLWVGVGGEVLDAVTWGSVGEGEATQLDPDFADPTANDDLANWCDATELFNPTDYGTPGGPNTQCIVEPPPGQCYENGQLRPIVPVPMGGLAIIELMTDPDAMGIPDDDGEWFEVYVSANGDLNGLELSKSSSNTIDTVEFEDVLGLGDFACLPAAAGDFVVFAHDQDPQVNGGLPQVDVLFQLGLNNDNSDLTIGYGGMAWAMESWGPTNPGASQSKDAMGNWCDGVDPYGNGDLGTPGGPNPACDGGNPPGQCTDPDTMMLRDLDPPTMADAVTLTEVMPNPSPPEQASEWFEIYTSGDFDLNGVQLGKNGSFEPPIQSDTGMCIEVKAGYFVFARSANPMENCMLPLGASYIYDGPGLTNGGDNLQIAFDNQVLGEYTWPGSADGVAWSYDSAAMLWCEATTPFGCGDLGTPSAANPACGMPGQCYDPQLMMMRDPVVPTVGDVVITEFMADPSLVPDADGEWFEIRALGSFDLFGLEVGKIHEPMAEPSIVVNPNGECMPVQPNDMVLFAVEGDPMLNGNLPTVDYVYSYNDLGLTNGASGLYLASEAELLDQVTWANNAAGRSTSLDPDSYDPLNNNNADAPPWCDMLANQQTPGEDNVQCP